MNDALQLALHNLLVRRPDLAGLVVFLANDLLFLMVAALLVTMLVFRTRLTWRWWAIAATAAVLCLLLAKIGGVLVADERPYLAGHYTPITHVANDNGFPSDHGLASSLTTLVAWPLNRAVAVAFGVLTLVIMAGRLTIGAHHTLDVLGSAFIAAVAVAVVTLIPWPAAWESRARARRIRAQ